MKWQQDKEGKNMRSLLTLLVVWIAEAIDRSLFTVPDLDEDHDSSAPSPTPHEYGRMQPTLR